jgi:hypothetical protein
MGTAAFGKHYHLPVVAGVVELLVGISPRTCPNLQLDTVGVLSVSDVQTLVSKYFDLAA